MIVISGAAGFIGSCLLSRLNNKGYVDIVLVDDFSDSIKNRNIEGKKYNYKIDRNLFFQWAEKNQKFIQIIFHLGARTDTAETNEKIFETLNLNYSKKVWNFCVKYSIGLIYASSAATYGLGQFGYKDSHEIIPKLQPLNTYAKSKNEFDKWVLNRKEKPYFWTGLKFFNVYGPNEYHKKRMASVILQAFRQINSNGKMKLFKSHHSKFKDGEQLRDFIYVKDVVDVLCFLMINRKNNGIYNLGTSVTNSFLTLTEALFKLMNKKIRIEFIDIPQDIRHNYQYFTKASIERLRAIGYKNKFTPLKKGIQDYLKNYLENNAYY